MRTRCLTLLVVIGAGWAPAGKEAKDATGGAALHVIETRTAEELRELVRYTGEPMHFVSAHRGGARAGFPENCIATFEDTLKHTFAVMEIDPRFTKDGHIVVHHDPTLERTTTGKGPVAEKTLAELKDLRLRDSEGRATEFGIPTLDEVLEWARGKTVLILDQKDVPMEVRVRKIEEHKAEAYAMVIVYSFKDARRCYDLNNDIMMEVMIPDRQKLKEFDATGVPWGNIVAFTGHTPPEDRELRELIHAKGACCLVGTSRNLDKELAKAAGDNASLEQQYRRLINEAGDLIETDLPREVGKLLYDQSPIPASKQGLLKRLPL